MKKIILSIVSCLSFLIAIQAQNLLQQQDISDTLHTDVYQKSDVGIQAKPPLDWYKFLGNNIQTHVATNKGVSTGKYKVFIEFIVEKDGSLTNIKALSGDMEWKKRLFVC